MIECYAIQASRRYPQDSKWWNKIIPLRRTPESREPRWGFVDRNEGFVAVGRWIKTGVDCATLTRGKGLAVKVTRVEGDLSTVTDEDVLDVVLNGVQKEAGK